MAEKYLAHYGVKGQKKGIRNYQSYETAPTRSGMVGEERGEAARHRKDITNIRRKYIENDQKAHNKELKSGEGFFSEGRRASRKKRLLEAWRLSQHNSNYQYYGRSSDIYAKKAKKAAAKGRQDKSDKFTARSKEYAKMYAAGKKFIRNMTDEDLRKTRRKYMLQGFTIGAGPAQYLRARSNVKAGMKK